MSPEKQTVSFVISAYNEASNIAVLIDELRQNEQPGFLYEYLFVDDGSTDGTTDELRKAAKDDNRIKYLSLTRNFGHEIAMTAGLDYATGDAVIFMDADLQHPPSLTPILIDFWQQGKKVVLTRRKNNEGRGIIYNLLSTLYYKLLSFLSEYNIKSNAPDFRLIDKKYVAIIRQFREHSRMFRGFIYWIDPSDEMTEVSFSAPKRHSGVTKYNVTKLFGLGIDAIVAFSIKPLRIALVISFLGMILSSGLGLYVLSSYFFVGILVPGFLPTILSSLAIGSIQLFVMTVIGEYIGRIHLEVKGRPLYVVKNQVNFSPDT